MGDRTGIAWTDATWNPVTGCTKVSAGCKNCYAEQVADRFWGDRKFTDVQCHDDRLDQPLRWRKPRRVFVNSMSDLFHDAVPDAFITRVFQHMGMAPHHTFQVLTKRPERMARMLHGHLGRWRNAGPVWVPTMNYTGVPLPHVWLGVSVEDQSAADERISLLLQTPAAVRFLSCEPLIGPLDLSRVVLKKSNPPKPNLSFDALCGWYGGAEPVCRTRIDWVIAGGESGPGARPCDVAWIRSLVQQCQDAAVPCFVKQLGALPVDSQGESIGEVIQLRVNDRKGGDPSEWPEDLRVQEFPR